MTQRVGLTHQTRQPHRSAGFVFSDRVDTLRDPHPLPHAEHTASKALGLIYA